MAVPVFTRIRNAWNAFRSQDETAPNLGWGGTYTARSDRPRLRMTTERSILGSIYTRMSVDISDVEIRHIKLDAKGRYLDDVDSKLNMCLQLEPNLDQGPRAFRQEIATTLFDKGCVAMVPVDTTVNPAAVDDFDVLTVRPGVITEWHPQHVKVEAYNEATGLREIITLEKRHLPIIENPLYGIMNEPNSTLQRLIRKLALLDNVDETSAGRLDMIIQLPYAIKSEARKKQAEDRRSEIEMQLKGSQFGIAYTDGAEKVTQLNRPADNQLLKQVEYLTTLLYTQLGLTEEIMNGTADEKTMLNYISRSVEPVLDAIIEAMQRSFLGVAKTNDGQRIRYFRNLFKLVTIADMAEFADKFSRNEILSPNEIRGIIGFAPSNDPKANELNNSNMPQNTDGVQPVIPLS